MPRKAVLVVDQSKNLLDRLEPCKQQINFSAHAAQLLARMLEELENRTWVEHNTEALAAHGIA